MKLGEGKREFGRQKAEDRMKRVAFGASRSCPQGIPLVSYLLTSIS